MTGPCRRNPSAPATVVLLIRLRRHAPLLLLQALVSLLLLLVDGKTIESEFQLSPSTTESVVGAFCISPHKGGHIKLTLDWNAQGKSRDYFATNRQRQLALQEKQALNANDDVLPREDKQEVKHIDSDHPIDTLNTLTLRLYRDDNWSDFQRATSCQDKAALAIENQTAFYNANNVINAPNHNTENDNNPHQQQHDEHKPSSTHFDEKNNVTIISMHIPNHKQGRAHYYYAVLTDCSLLLDESFMDNANANTNNNNGKFPVTVEYTLEFTNNGSHLSADELHLNIMHMVTVFVSGSLATMLALKVLIELYEEKQHTIHAAVLWVMAAAASDSLASLFAIMHMELYAHNGIGSPLLDSLSCHLEATCDSLVAFLLLSIGSGWTLPSDVIPTQRYFNHNHKSGGVWKQVMRGLQSPFCIDGNATFSSWLKSPTVLLASFIFLSHVLLAQWGLHSHNNDFDSYHDLENLPGKTLMILRGLLGVCLWVCCANTKHYIPVNNSLRTFYNQLALVGTLWFESLPILTWIVNSAVAVHLRHRTIGVWGASLQMISIALLSWLVMANSQSSHHPYHKFSHVSSPQRDSLTERLSLATSPSSAAPPVTGETVGLRNWIMLGKTKVRLD